MRYFTYDLWKCINTGDREEMARASAQWAENDRAYSMHFERIKTRFTKSFFRSFVRHRGFHDAIITSAQMDTRRKQVILILDDAGSMSRILFDKVSFFTVEPGDPEDCEWGYSELDATEDGNLYMNILCSGGQEIGLTFRRVRIEEIEA